MIYNLKIFFRFLKYLLTHPRSWKYFGQWARYKFFIRKKDNISAELPWMNLEVISWLRTYLKPEMKMFEWGSGGSTFFYSNLVGQVISIEYDEGYYGIVKKQLEEKGRKNVELVLTPPQDEGECKSFSPGYVGRYFDDYTRTIDQYPERSFDVIVVDGRQRNECFKKALGKLKPDGIIVFDNFEREIYKKSQYFEDLQYFNIEGLMPFGYVIGTTAIFYFGSSGKALSR